MNTPLIHPSSSGRTSLLKSRRLPGLWPAFQDLNAKENGPQVDQTDGADGRKRSEETSRTFHIELYGDGASLSESLIQGHKNPETQ